METKPILKWAGGKRQIINELLSRMPHSYNNYFEPFVGGGALYFAVQPKSGCISDINSELINVYKVVSSVNLINSLINVLDYHRLLNSKEYFQEIRGVDRTDNWKYLSDIQRASRFIYLNKTCFNGLYRVNSKGKFNTPFGNYNNPNILDRPNLIECNKLLRTIKIENIDFSEALRKPCKGDFVYLDPPYDPVKDTSNFTSYTKDGFDKSKQSQLKACCDDLNKRDVMFMLSNSNTEFIRDLYKDYHIDVIQAKRSINSDATKRGKVEEVIVRNY